MNIPKIRLTRFAKRRLWLLLPYRVRLRIERNCFVALMITKHEKQISLTRIQALKLPLYRKMSLLYEEIQRLNNPYSAFTNAPISKKDVESAARIQSFLIRVSNTHHFNS